jgi:hypothetical protein
MCPYTSRVVFADWCPHPGRNGLHVATAADQQRGEMVPQTVEVKLFNLTHLVNA